MLLCIFDLSKYLNSLISPNTSRDVGNSSDLNKMGISTSVFLRMVILVELTWQAANPCIQCHGIICLFKIPLQNTRTSTTKQSHKTEHIHSDNQQVLSSTSVDFSRTSLGMNFIMVRLGGTTLLGKCSQQAQFECSSSLLGKFYGQSELILENSMVALEASRSILEPWPLSVFSPVLSGGFRLPFPLFKIHWCSFFFPNKEKVIIVFIFI